MSVAYRLDEHPRFDLGVPGALAVALLIFALGGAAWIAYGPAAPRTAPAGEQVIALRLPEAVAIPPAAVATTATAPTETAPTAGDVGTPPLAMATSPATSEAPTPEASAPIPETAPAATTATIVAEPAPGVPETVATLPPDISPTATVSAAETVSAETTPLTTTAPAITAPTVVAVTETPKPAAKTERSAEALAAIAPAAGTRATLAAPPPASSETSLSGKIPPSGEVSAPSPIEAAPREPVPERPALAEPIPVEPVPAEPVTAEPVSSTPIAAAAEPPEAAPTAPAEPVIALAAPTGTAPPEPGPATAPPDAAPSSPADTTPAPTLRPAWLAYATPFAPAGDRPRIAVVVTGLGPSPAAARAAIRLPASVTLGFASYTRDLQRWIDLARAAGHEVLLDVPMEPETYPRDDPGPLPLLTSLSIAENLKRLDWHLSRASGYIGVTHDMGSRFTASTEDMRPILTDVRARGLMFLDARTARHSVGDAVAAALNVPRVANDRFIDAQAARPAIDKEFRVIERIARRDGEAVAIGHAFPVTLDMLNVWLGGLAKGGFALAPLSAVIVSGATG